MPRPTRKAKTAAVEKITTAPRPTRAARSTQLHVEVVIDSQSDTDKRQPARQLHSHTTSAVSPTKQQTLGASPTAGTPQKRPSVNSPLSTPRSPTSYGRRSSSTHRLSASGGIRRISGAFVSNDEVIDGISPIRRDGPLENLVEGDEDGLASRHNGRALEFGPVKRKRADSSELVDADKVLDASVEGTASTTAERNASSDDSRFAEEPVDSEESDSDVFDIDKLVAENTTTATPRPTRSRRTNVASRMAAGELTTRDWLEEPSVGGQLPKRHRTQQQTKTPTKKPGKKAAANDRKQRLAVDADGSEESAHEPDEPWRSEKPAARSSRTRAAAKTKDAIKTGTRATYGKKRATATQHQPQAELWNPESALTTHFDEIDGYELAEETV